MCLGILTTLAPSGIFLKTHWSSKPGPGIGSFSPDKQSGNFGGVIGGQLLKWNLMSSEWKCFLYRRRFSFWYLRILRAHPRSIAKG